MRELIKERQVKSEMKYPLNTENYHTFEIFEVNKLPPRSYFIPYPDRAGADAAAPKEKR